jgi:hypothetical protein
VPDEHTTSVANGTWSGCPNSAADRTLAGSNDA